MDPPVSVMPHFPPDAKRSKAGLQVFSPFSI
uniref:Uncharacterized protein n=1 Tax=Anguilla anguilla TaxID=7936 RepID=A0A0E9QNL0_ANGAN